MDKLNEVQIFKTGSTIANGGQLTDAFVNKYKTAIDGLNLSQAQAVLNNAPFLAGYSTKIPPIIKLD